MVSIGEERTANDFPDTKTWHVHERHNCHLGVRVKEVTRL